MLDVGCGCFSEGDVNCDLFVGKNVHSPQVIKPKLVKNFVRCDGQFLPFRDGVFDVVRCFHVIEHVLNPFLLLRELVRVSCYKVWLRCPHRFGDKFRIQVLRKKCDSHLHFLNKRWFVEFGSRLGCYVYCKTIGFLGLPFVNFLPNELEVNLIKC